MSNTRAGYTIQQRRNVLDGRRELRRSPHGGQDTGDDPPENERMAGMAGYSRQDLPVMQDFPT